MRFATFLTILGLLTLIGCSTSGSKSTTSANTLTDEDLEHSIKAQIVADPAIPPSAVDVSASAEKNEATLTGTLPSEELRTRAVDLAKASRPGLVVTDKIDVKPPEVARTDFTDDMARDARRKATELGDKIGNSLDDAWIYTKVVSKVAANRGTPALKINVDVTNQAVTLRGQVESPEAKAEVERIAKDTDGVKRVSNMLRVKSS